jgi:hypothetical protein
MKLLPTTKSKTVSRAGQRGQSLVEVALFFPIFVILLAGLVEVSQLLVTQNRVSSAARAAARFASNGGQDEGIPTTILNTVTQTLETDESLWDIWSIRATINANGTDFTQWQFTHVYGISNTVRAPSVDEDEIRSQVLDELRRDENQATAEGIANNLQIVGTYAIHDVDSILGLDAMSQLAGFSSINALSVMRITANTQNVTNGCAAFPIAVSGGTRSVTAPGTGSSPYPAANEFSYPTTNRPTYNTFVNHRPDEPLDSAREGYIFRLPNGTGNGNFDWLVWNQGISDSAANLAASLDWPGNSTNYTLCPTCGGLAVAGSGFGGIVRGYIEPGDVTDQTIHVDDWVLRSVVPISSGSVQTALQEHIQLDRTLRLIVWDTYDNTHPPYGRYQISGFAVFRIIGYSNSWILAEFIRWDNSCGQVN